MAFPATLVIQVQSTGSDTNGGGFDPVSGVPGTDYSLQDAPQVIHNDAVIGTPNTTATSAANPYTSAHVGNVENFTSGTGWTVQRAQIMSVSGGVATFDKALGTIGSTGGNGRLGGALATPGMAGAFKVASNKVWIKAGTYSGSATANVSGGRVSDTTVGTSSAPNRWEGYHVTRGDRTGTRPVFNAGANSMTIMSVTAAYGLIENIDFGNGAAFTGVTGMLIGGSSTPGATVTAVDCTATGINVGFSSTGSNSVERYLNCRAVNCPTGFSFAGWNKSALNCSASGSTTAGFASSATNTLYVNCLTDGCATGFSCTVGPPTCIRCTADLCSSRGFFLGAGSWVEGCLATRCTVSGFGASAALTDTIRLIRCAGWSNTLDYDANYVGTMVQGFVQCSADPYVAKASGDYRPNNTAGGGALLRGVGSPQAIPGYSAANAPDIGAYQHQDSGGGTTYYAS